MVPIQQDDERWLAVCHRDRRWDGLFVYAVSTTYVYCRPSCPSRQALLRHVCFYPNAEAAERAGYRPCKRCVPNHAELWHKDQHLALAACRMIEQAEFTPSLADLADAAGLSRYHFHRLFRRVIGMTPKAYGSAYRAEQVRTILREENTDVTTSLYQAGFASSSSFYQHAPELLGMSPSRYRRNGAGEVLCYEIAVCSLGLVLVAASELGICAVLLGDDERVLTEEVRHHFRAAEFREDAPGKQWLRRHFSRIVAIIDGRVTPDQAELPLDVRGTAFQHQVWQELMRIPAGDVVSYGELARRIGKPARAARAVGGACGANRIAVIVPCHRVSGASNRVGGYAWGKQRKLRLLTREKEAVTSLRPSKNNR